MQAAHDKVQKRAAAAQQRAAHYKQRADESRRALRQAPRTVRAFEVLCLAGRDLTADWLHRHCRELTSQQWLQEGSEEKQTTTSSRRQRRQMLVRCLSAQVLAGKLPCNELGVAHMQRGVTAAHDPSLLWKLERLEHQVLDLVQSQPPSVNCHGTGRQLVERKAPF